MSACGRGGAGGLHDLFPGQRRPVRGYHAAVSGRCGLYHGPACALFYRSYHQADVHYGADGVYVICGGCGDRDFYGTVWLVPGGYVGVVGGLFPDLWSVFCGQPYGHAFEGKGGEPEDGGGAASYQGDERQESL